MRRLAITTPFVTNPVFVTGTGLPFPTPNATVLDLDPNIHWCYRLEVVQDPGGPNERLLYGDTEAFRFPDACVSNVVSAAPSCVDNSNGTATVSGSITATNTSIVTYYYQYGSTANNCTGHITPNYTYIADGSTQSTIPYTITGLAPGK